MRNDHIVIRGARENNLKNLTFTIPKYKLVVLTGPSGSGKSTLAMDTLQRECQRQYLESLGLAAATAYGKPKVDAITGLSPSISVGQHVTNRNPRSTVGTVTDLYTYLRILYEQLGERPCPHCGKPAPANPPEGEGAGGTDRTGSLSVFDEDGPDADGLMRCAHCAGAMPRMTRSHFSFNKPEGACPTCGGLGRVYELDADAVFAVDKSLREGAVTFWIDAYAQYQIQVLEAAAKHYGLPFDADLPLQDWDPRLRDLLAHGVESEAFSRHFPGVNPPRTVNKGKFEGVLTGMWRRFREKEGASGEAAYFHEQACGTCRGARLKPEVRQVTLLEASIDEVANWPLARVADWARRLEQWPEAGERPAVGTFLHDFAVRLGRITDVGLGYLSLDRQAVTLSGGEAQRLRLASILGSGLSGVLYILDEPTIGLHPKDTDGLIHVLKQLRDLGNTVLVIEHDVKMMRAADHVIDMGPGAGLYGGRIVGEGTLDQLAAMPESVTGAHIREEAALAQAGGKRWRRRPVNGPCLTVHGAHARNLQRITVRFPLGCLIAVTGVSGSGKSTLVFDLLAAGGTDGQRRQGVERITGLEEIGEIITMDQSPMVRMSRSNVATYTDVFTLIRHLYAGLPEAKEAGLKPKHFSFNMPGGRCEHCQGLGKVPVELHFLDDLEVRCPVCRGKRFTDEVLRVTYRGHSISDLLDMSVQESLAVLEDRDNIAATIRLLCEVGLGYLQWGQSLRTLSGGEGQRLRLARQLNKPSQARTLYLLDEPTTGLHPSDVKRLLLLLHRLVDAGHTVIAVEHNLDVIREADWVVDLGPEGGEAGGRLLAEGTPEEVAQAAQSHTGRYLRTLL